MSEAKVCGVYIRRKGNKFYLVHNVRGAEDSDRFISPRLGERAQITERVVREVPKKHPFVNQARRFGEALRGR